MPRNRTSSTIHATIHSIWKSLHLPSSALSTLSLPPDPQDFPQHNTPRFLPSSYKLDHLAQSSIALATLAAALLHATRAQQSSQRQQQQQPQQQPIEHNQHEINVPRVTISPRGAALSFVSERVYTLSGQPPRSSGMLIGGLYRTRDAGWVRVHDAFVNHRRAVARILGVSVSAEGMVDREEVARAIRERWGAEELERAALSGGAVVGKLRRDGEGEWDGWPLGGGDGGENGPVRVERFAVPEGRMGEELRGHFGRAGEGEAWLRRRPLQGLRVLELSRVIAAPVAGRALAALGADVLWLTAPHLPDLPPLDVDLSRGKRTIQLDFRREQDKRTLLDLVRDADVFIQSYRPDSLDRYGLAAQDLATENPGIVYASLSAYGEGDEELNRKNP
ncbi:hypothetical protein PRK78_003064 [Emydomyces testavorans]|uniref:Uncharacterized protein n=1 Tax=Emydomyces testavorans TaxID=2070801 RepID=A0AAF0II59_9EURO|nr:hypothetical protein PRK78_003064 [Emydomyces testavorans]